MTPKQFLSNILTTALDKTAHFIEAETSHDVTARLEKAEVTWFDTDGATASADLVWRMIPNDTPAAAFDLPTRVGFDIIAAPADSDTDAPDLRVRTRGGCDIEIGGVPTIVSGEDYTDADSAGRTINLMVRQSSGCYCRQPVELRPLHGRGIDTGTEHNRLARSGNPAREPVVLIHPKSGRGHG